jgi:PBP1b-binding outer membrane lipoprotein LpoB
MKNFAIICLAALFLASCQTEMEAPKLKVSAPSVTIGGGGGHCPPGHAKKGWC